jgi:hypothetical protein
VSGRRSAAEYYAHFTSTADLTPDQEQAVAEYVRSHTRPGEPFAQWTSQAALPFLADRPSVSRFPTRGLFVYLRGPRTEGYFREYLDRVRRLRPTYIVVSMPVVGGFRTAREALEREGPELAAIVAARYTLEKSIGPADLYRLRPGAAEAPAPVGRGGPSRPESGT